MSREKDFDKFKFEPPIIFDYKGAEWQLDNFSDWNDFVEKIFTHEFKQQAIVENAGDKWIHDLTYLRNRTSMITIDKFYNELQRLVPDNGMQITDELILSWSKELQLINQARLRL